MVRVSTGMIFDAGVGAMQKRTATLLRTQQQLASGRRILSPADDPVAAARALEVTQARANNAGQAQTRDNAKSALGLAESQLAGATDLLVRVRELAVQAGSGALAPSDRRSIATELRARFEELVALANSSDGTGQYLFGGYQSSGRPFAGSVENGVNYGGDDGLRTLEVSDSRLLPVSDAGSDVFQRIQNGNGVFATAARTAAPTNIRAATIDAGTVTGLAAWSVAPTELALSFFVDADGKTYYDLLNTATGNSAYTGTTSAASTRGSLTGSANLAVAPTAITAANNVLSLTVDGTAHTVTLPVGTYTRDGLVTQLQALYDAIPAGVTVSASGNGLAFTSNSFGAASTVITPAGSGAATLVGGAPTTVAGTAGTHTRLFVSGQAIALSSTTVPFDYGASVTVTGNPIGGDRFIIARDGTGNIATSPAAITHGLAAISKGSVTNAIKWTTAANSQNIELRFQTNAAGKAFYDLVDVTNGKSLYTGTVSVPAGAGTLTGNANLSAGVTIATATNDVFSIDVDAVTRTVTVPPGTYTQAGLVAELQRQFDALAPAGVKVVVGSSGNALKFSSPTLGATSTVTNPAGTAAATLVGGGPYTSATGTAGTYNQAYTSGTAINLKSPPTFDFGAVVTVTGNPADGDAFTVKGSGDGVTGNGYFVTAAKTTAAVNAGSGIVGAGEVHDQAKWNSPRNSRNLEVRFWKNPAVPGSLYYDLVDRETEKSLFTNTTSSAGGSNNTFTHAFSNADAISFTGLHTAYSQGGGAGDFGVTLTISGTPASGDAFVVAASSSQSVFSTLARLVTTLETGGTSGGLGDTQFHNELGGVLTDLSRAEDNILRVRARMGSHLGEVDSLDSRGENLNLHYDETLARLQDLDYAKAISDLTRQQIELEAAQKSFVQVSRLSLFDYV